MVSLDDRTIDRLAKVCGLLGSDHDGERSAAAYRATRILKEAGLTWDDLVRRRTAPVVSQEPQRAAGSMAWRDMARYCQQHADLLTTWEAKFLASIMTRWSLTPKQHAALQTICDKLERRV